MWNTEPVMSFMKRPDERRREAARIARASQARPLVESEPGPVVRTDNTFNMVVVPNSQLDDISRNVMKILGPYHTVLGGPPTNGLRAARVSDLICTGSVSESNGVAVGNGDCGNDGKNIAVPLSSNSHSHQMDSKMKHTNSSLVTVNSFCTTSPLSNVNSKKTSLLAHSPNHLAISSQSTPKLMKPPLLPTPGSCNAQQPTSLSSSVSLSTHVAVTSSSSAVGSNLPHKESSNMLQNGEGRKDGNSLKGPTSRPPSMHFKPDISVPSTDEYSQHENTFPRSHNFSKSEQHRVSSGSSAYRREGFSPTPSNSDGVTSMGGEHPSSRNNQHVKLASSSLSPPLRHRQTDPSPQQLRQIHTSPPPRHTHIDSLPQQLRQIHTSPTPRLGQINMSPEPYLGQKNTSSISPSCQGQTNISSPQLPRVMQTSSLPPQLEQTKASLTPLLEQPNTSSSPPCLLSTSTSTLPLRLTQTNTSSTPQMDQASSVSKTFSSRSAPTSSSRVSTPKESIPDPPSLSQSHSTSSKPKTSLLNGINLQNSTKSNRSDSASTPDKVKLKLDIKSAMKMPTSKSDLHAIIQEMADLHAPLTAIETPVHVENGFIFTTSDLSVTEPSLNTSGDDQKKALQKSTDEKSDADKDLIKKVELAKKEENSSFYSSLLPSDHCTESNHEAEEDKIGTGEVITSVENIVTTPAAPDPIRCSSSSNIESKDLSLRSVENTVYDVNSILRGDLDLSEDSDAEPTFDDNTSACQSNRGKVISISPEIPVERRVLSPTSSSSSSSSSSESGSDCSGDEDDNIRKNGEAGEKDTTPKKSLERRLSSSSSSSSSSCSSQPSSDEEDGAEDDQHETDVRKTPDRMSKTAAEKTDTASTSNVVSSAALASLSSSVQDINSTGMTWCLKNFIQQPKKSLSSPASISPHKPVSPLMTHSTPPSVQKKDDSFAKTTEATDSSQCDRVQKISEENAINVHAVEKCKHNNPEVLKQKDEAELSLGKASEPPAALTSLAFERSEKTNSVMLENSSKNACSKETSAEIASQAKKLVGKEVTRSSLSGSSAKHERKEHTLSVASLNSAKVSKIVPLDTDKPDRTVSRPSSNEDIDVMSFTPDEKSKDRLMPPSCDKMVNAESRQVVSKQLFNTKSVEKNNEGLKSTKLHEKSAPIHDIKHHKRKNDASKQHSLTSISTCSSSKPSSKSSTIQSDEAVKSSKKRPLDSMDLLEDATTSKLPGHLSALQPTKSSHSLASSKQLPTVSSSATTSPSPTTISTVPFTPSHNSDGNSKHKIVVQIQNSFLSKEVISGLQKKKESRAGAHKKIKLLESSLNSKALPETSKNSLVPESKTLSNSNKDIQSLSTPQTTESSSLPSTQSVAFHSSKSMKQKSNNSVATARNGGTSNHLNKTLKHPQSSSKDIVSTSSVLESAPPNQSSKAIPSSNSSASILQPAPASSSQPASNNSTSSSPAAHNNTASSKSANNLQLLGGDVNKSSRSDKTEASKRKSDTEEESTCKKSRLDEVVENSSTSSKRSDSISSKVSHKSISKRSTNADSTDASNNNNNSKPAVKAGEHVTNGPVSNGLPFNHYVSSSNSSSTTSAVVLPSSSSLTANLPPPAQVETQLHTTKHYLARAREHKHHADNLKDKLAKYEPYLRSGLSFFLAGYSMEITKREMSCSMYNDTSKLLQYVIQMRTHSSFVTELTDKERKLLVLLVRLQAYLNHRLYRLKGTEVNMLRKVIESEQSKLLSSATTSGSSSTTNTAATSKPHAPSPHQTNWNKNSTGTPSPMSPTPSPSGSVSSQGSCEFATGKIQNGTTSSSSTPMTSPSPVLVNIQQQVQSLSQRYFTLTTPMVKSLDLWEQADTDSRSFGDFFAVLDNACGPLSLHTDPLVVVRYMKHALRLLNLLP